MWFLSQLFTEGLLQKHPCYQTLLIGSMAVMSHAAITSDARSIQISSQNIGMHC